jgi:gliding motility-associated-like protein
MLKTLKIKKNQKIFRSFFILIFLNLFFLNILFSSSINSFLCTVSIGNIIKPIHIEHIPIEKIYGINNTVNFTVDILDTVEVERVTLFYKYKEDSVFSSRNFTLVKSSDLTINSYSGIVAVTDTELNKTGEFLYYIEVKEVNNDSPYYWGNKNSSSPQSVMITTDLKEIVVSEKGGVFVIDDGAGNTLLSLDIPEGALSTTTNIKIKQKNISYTEYLNGNNPAVAFEFEPKGLKFLKPISMEFKYTDNNNNGNVDNLSSGVDSIYNLRAYYWENSSKWELYGGVVSKNNKSVLFKTDHFSVYALFYTKLDKAGYRPKYRIFTPNGDGINDKIQFLNLDNESLLLRFFDINGRKVRDLKQPPYEWDGRDNSGRLVESGIYIYQFKVKIDDKEQYVNGTVALAK